MVSEIDYDRLGVVIKADRQKLQKAREQRGSMIDAMLGDRYSDSDGGLATPVNYLRMAANIYSRSVAARHPQVVCETKNPRLKQEARAFAEAINQRLKKMDATTIFRDWVEESLLKLGVVKCGLAANSQVAADEQNITNDPEQFYCNVIDFDEFCYDTAARTWDSCAYMADRYRVSRRALLQMAKSLDISTEDINKLPGLTKRTVNETGESKSKHREGQERAFSPEAYVEDMIELWDVWMPTHGKILTFLASDDGSINTSMKPVREVEWSGPERGPYIVMPYGRMPGGLLLPLSPLDQLADLHDLQNSLFRKMSAQAQRQKNVGVALGGDAKTDGEAVIQANDGDVLNLSGTTSVQEIGFGGVDQNTLLFSTNLRDLFSYLGGNLDALGGLGRSSDTASQDEMITSSASVAIADLQDRTTYAVKRVIQSLAHYLWESKFETIVEMVVEGTETKYQRRFVNDGNIGSFEDYEIDIAPYSMQDRGPMEKAANLTRVMTQIAMPMAPLLERQGMKVDLPAYFDELAYLTNAPEIKRIIRELTPQEIESMMKMMQQASGGSNEASTAKPPSTTRNYVRKSVPGATREGKDLALQQGLLGSSQPAQERVMTAPNTG